MGLDGLEFVQDDKVVYLKLKGFCQNTPAWEWNRELDGKMSGQNAMQALYKHYEGYDEVRK
jgi:hypothetical protein